MSYIQPSVKVRSSEDESGLIVGSYSRTVRSEDEILSNEYNIWEEEEEDEPSLE